MRRFAALPQPVVQVIWVALAILVASLLARAARLAAPLLWLLLLAALLNRG